MFGFNACILAILVCKCFVFSESRDELQSRVANLEELVHKLNGMINELIVSNSYQEREILELKQTRCSCGEEDAPSLNKGKRLLEGTMAPKTAFYAYMNGTEKNPTKSHTLVFNDVRVNINNAYSGNSGTFRAPVAGTYVFTFSLRVYGGGVGSYEIIKNGNPEGAAIAIIPAGSSDDQEQITATIVIVANQGDEIYVRTHSSLAHAGDLLSNHHGRSMFAGWMI